MNALKDETAMNVIKKLKDLFRNDVTKESSLRDNYIENKNEAINKICAYLSKYSCSADKNLAVLKLWIVTEERETEVAWADANFVKELKARLQQERVDAIKTIEISNVSLEEIQDIISKRKNNDILPIVKDRLYYRTHPISESKDVDSKTAQEAWLVCVGGEDKMEDRVIFLSPEKKVWNIGRSAKPTIIDINEIIIKDDCKEISRQHAAIVIEDGNFYLKCKEGGCRRRGGRLTKIIRGGGTKDELVSLSHKALPPLQEGDIIQLSKEVYLKFTHEEPSEKDTASAIQIIDDSF